MTLPQPLHDLLPLLGCSCGDRMREELGHHLLLVPRDPGHLQLHLGERRAQLEDDPVSAGGLEPCWLGYDQRHPVLGEGGCRWPPEPGWGLSSRQKPPAWTTVSCPDLGWLEDAVSPGMLTPTPELGPSRGRPRIRSKEGVGKRFSSTDTCSHGPGLSHIRLAKLPAQPLHSGAVSCPIP